MAGKAFFQEGAHGPALREGVTTALSWLSILPFQGASVFDRTTGARVMAALPVVGVVFGCFTAVLLGVLYLLNAPTLLSAVLVVLLWELLNRMMHLDGLADVADALGSYTAPERAREILADPHTGLMGFTAVLFSLLVQISAIASLLEEAAWGIICFLPALSRLGGQILAREGRQPLSPTGFGAMLIGTVHLWWVVLWWLVLSLLAAAWVFSPLPAGPLFWGLLVPVAGLVTGLVSELSARHFSRRFNGLNGDCIGAVIHLSTAVNAALCALAISAS